MLTHMLDTNICIYAIKNRPAGLRDRFNEMSDRLCISSVVYGELIYGAEKSARPAANLQTVEGFAARLAILAFDTRAAAHFGQIYADLTLQGQRIGPYDLMIGGHARAEGLILVTNNDREFRRVDGLRLENWAA